MESFTYKIKETFPHRIVVPKTIAELMKLEEGDYIRVHLEHVKKEANAN